MEKDKAKIKLDKQPKEEEVEVELELIQTVIDEHGKVRSKTYKNTKTGEETVETF